MAGHAERRTDDPQTPGPETLTDAWLWVMLVLVLGCLVLIVVHTAEFV
jgi:hypothetical protein